MSIGEWATGLVVVLLEITALGLGARALRRRLVPTWRGAEAALASAVLGVGGAVAIGLALGTVGLLLRWAVLVVTVVAGSATAVLVAAGGPRQEPGEVDPTDDAPSPATSAIAVVSALAVVVTWVSHTVAAYRRGIYDGDSLWYHLPFIARFATDGRITAVEHVSPQQWIAYFPANIELVDALTVVAFGSDVLVPLVNLGWLALALLAAWCLGGTVGHRVLPLLATAWVLSLPWLAPTNAGTARVDVALVALVLSAAAAINHRRATGGSAAIAGVALGVAIGTKFTGLPVTGLVLVAASAVLALRHRRAAAAFAGAAVSFGGYWYLRNWIAVGNPVPAMSLHFGPISLDAAQGTSTASTSIVSQLGEPGFSRLVTDVLDGFSGGWLPLVLVAAITAIGLFGVATGGASALAVSLVVAGALAVAYHPFAPNSAPLAGADPASPVASLIVALNTRYLLAALALVLCLAAAELGRRWPRAMFAATTCLAAAITGSLRMAHRISKGGEWTTLTSDWVVAGVLVPIALAALVLRRHRVVVATAVLLVPIGGWWVADHYAGARYRDLAGVSPDVADHGGVAIAWAEDNPGQRIGLLGSAFQYVWTGRRLQNDLHYLGVDLPHGGFRDVESCDEFGEAVRNERVDVVLVAPRGVEAEEWARSVRGATIELELPTALLVAVPATPTVDCQ